MAVHSLAQFLPCLANTRTVAVMRPNLKLADLGVGLYWRPRRVCVGLRRRPRGACVGLDSTCMIG